MTSAFSLPFVFRFCGSFSLFLFPPSSSSSSLLSFALPSSTPRLMRVHVSVRVRLWLRLLLACTECFIAAGVLFGSVRTPLAAARNSGTLNACASAPSALMWPIRLSLPVAAAAAALFLCVRSWSSLVALFRAEGAYSERCSPPDTTCSQQGTHTRHSTRERRAKRYCATCASDCSLPPCSLSLSLSLSLPVPFPDWLSLCCCPVLLL